MTPSTDPNLPTVFISYAHADKLWCDFVSLHLKGLREIAHIFGDFSIPADQDFLVTLEKAIDSAQVAVILVSADYLASDIIQSIELPHLIERAHSGHLTLVIVPVRHALWDASPLSEFEPALPPNRPLASLTENEQEAALVEVIKVVKDLLVHSIKRPKAVPVSMYIKQLELHNFKNFRHEIIRFPDPTPDQEPLAM
jgi:TIR domain